MSESNFNAAELAPASCSRFGVSGRAVFMILVVVCAAFGASSAYLYRTQSSVLRADLNASMSSLSAASARSVGNWLRGKLELTQLMAQQIAAVGARPKANDVLGLPLAREVFFSAYLGRPDGFYTEMPKTELPAGYDPRERPWYKDALEAGQAVLTEPYTSAGTDVVTITATGPIFGENRAILGVIGGDFDSAALTRMIAEVATGDKS